MKTDHVEARSRISRPCWPFKVRPMPFVVGGEIRAPHEPASENEAFLRKEILDSLARRAEYNLSRMNGDVRIFEIGSVFAPSSEETPSEELRAAVLVMGRRSPPHFSDPKSPEFDAWVRYDHWDAKAIAEELAAVSFPGAAIELAPGEGESLDDLVGGAARGSVQRLVLTRQSGRHRRSVSSPPSPRSTRWLPPGENARTVQATSDFCHAVSTATHNSGVGVRSGASRARLGARRRRRGGDAPRVRQAARKRPPVRSVRRTWCRSRVSQS